MAGTTWPALVAGNKARASEVESKFDWVEGSLVPMNAGNSTDSIYDLGTSTARWQKGWIEHIDAGSSNLILEGSLQVFAQNSSGFIMATFAGTGNIIQGPHLRLHHTASSTYFQITNSTTGATAGSSGFIVEVLSNTARLINYENSKVEITTNNEFSGQEFEVIPGGSITLPRISTTQRDSSVTAGHGVMHYNTTTTRFSGHDGTEWKDFLMESSAGAVSVGGVLSVVGALSGSSISLSGAISAASADLSGNLSVGGNLDVSGTAAIGTTTANASSQLEIAGTKALLIPRLSTTQRDALTGANGMMVYNTTTSKFQIYESGGWKNMSGKLAGLVPLVTQTNVTAAFTDVVNVTGAGTLFGISGWNDAGITCSVLLTIDGTEFNTITAALGGVTASVITIGLHSNAAASPTFIWEKTSSTQHQELNVNFASSLRIQMKPAAANTMTTKVLYEIG